MHYDLLSISLVWTISDSLDILFPHIYWVKVKNTTIDLWQTTIFLSTMFILIYNPPATSLCNNLTVIPNHVLFFLLTMFLGKKRQVANLIDVA